MSRPARRARLTGSGSRGGQKVAQAGTDTTLRYGEGTFLASSVDMPVVGQVLEASRARPYLVANFELPPHEVLAVLSESKVRVGAAAPAAPAAFVGTCDERLLDVVLRAVTALEDERDARFLAPLLRKELIYRLVTGPSGALVCQSALLARPDEGVGRAVDWLKVHFKEPLSIPELAKRSKMSASSLHHQFKAAVMMGPLQYSSPTGDASLAPPPAACARPRSCSTSAPARTSCPSARRFEWMGSTRRSRGWSGPTCGIDSSSTWGASSAPLETAKAM